MTRRLIAACLGVGLALNAGLTPSIAYAEAPASQVTAVTDAVDTADFDRAETLARELIESGELSRAQAARVYLELGLVYCARLDGPAADDAFRSALALAPDLALPPSAGPHVSDAFAKAKANAASSVPSISIRLAPSKDRSGVDVDASVSSDDRHLARTLLLAWPGGRESRPLAAGPNRLAVPLGLKPGGACTEVVAAVGDEHGNPLWPDLSRASVCPPPLPLAPSTARTPSPQRRPVPARVWVAGTVTLAAAAATTVLGVIALDRRASYHQMNQDATTSVADREAERTDALNAEHRATAAGVITVIGAAATIVLYLTRPDGHISRSSLGPAVAVASF